MRASRSLVPSAVLLVCLLHYCTSADKVVVEIDVNTGLQTFAAAPKARATATADPHSASSWPESVDLDGVRIHNPGEDATGPVSPEVLIVRALQKLPESEQERIGLTALLAETHARGDPSPQLEPLKTIWDRRQSELKEATEALSETATVLAGLIDQLNAGQHRTAEGAGDFADQASALASLEDYLSDMDNARDFHDALGGWRPLTRLISPRPRWRLAFSPGTVTANTASAAASAAAAAAAQPATPLEVRAAAAMVVGTAVKNEAGFQLWVLESAVDDVDPAGLAVSTAKPKRWTKTEPRPMYPQVPANETVLSSLLELLVPAPASHDAAAVSQATLAQRRALYSVGSAVRNNPAVAACFTDLRGADALAHALESVDESDAEGGWALRTKGLALAADLINEERLAEHTEGAGTEGTAAVEFLVSRRWRRLVLGSLGGGLGGQAPDKAAAAALELAHLQWGHTCTESDTPSEAAREAAHELTARARALRLRFEAAARDDNDGDDSFAAEIAALAAATEAKAAACA